MGKKYIIELCDKPMKTENGGDIWRVKGFNTLVFDQNGLDKLEEYAEDSKYKEGWADGYNTARKKYDVSFFEDGDEVIDEDGNLYVFITENDGFTILDREGYKRKFMTILAMVDELNIVKTGRKVEWFKK